MTKSGVRTLKSHYLSRWAVLRHNKKHQKKILLFTDQFVLKNLLPGNTLVYKCLGDMYQGIIPNLSVNIDPTIKYNNLVLINNIDLKYKTPDQICQYVEQLATELVAPGGRIILSFEHRFLIYNRVEVSVDCMLDDLSKNFKRARVKKILNLLSRSQPGYGDYFFCLDYL